MERMTGSSPLGGELWRPLLAIELCDELLLLRTSVGASEKEVCDRGTSTGLYVGPGTVIGEALPACGVCRPPRADDRPSRAPFVGNEGVVDLSTADSGEF